MFKQLNHFCLQAFSSSSNGDFAPINRKMNILKIFPSDKAVSISFIAFLLLMQFNIVANASETELDIEKPVFFLGAGDIVRVFVWNHTDLSLNVPVNPNGMINYPLIGELNASGMTEKGLETIISKKLSTHIKTPLVSVTLIELNSYAIYVTGEVIRSGLFNVKNPITATQAIAMAGGFTPFANKQKIIIINRETGKRRLFNFNEYINDEQNVSDVFLKSGDTVYVK